MFILINFFPEQGCRNDLLSKRDGVLPQDPDDRHLLNSTKTKSSLVSTPGFSTNIISDRVHCNPLLPVASGSRCHTADYLNETKDGDNSVPCPMDSLSKSPPPLGPCYSSPVQTPPSPHSVPLLLLLMFIVPLYFIVFFAVQVQVP